MTALSDLCAVTISAPSAPAALSPVPAPAAVPAVALQAAAHFSDGTPPRGLEALTPCPAALAEALEAVGSAFEGAPRRTADAHPRTMRPVHSPAAGDALPSAPGLAVTEGEMPARPTPAAEFPVVAGPESSPSAPRTDPSSLPTAGAQTAPATEMPAQPMRVPTPAAGDSADRACDGDAGAAEARSDARCGGCFAVSPGSRRDRRRNARAADARCGSPCGCGPCIRPVRASDGPLLPAGCGSADRACDGDGGAAGARSDARGG